jgi:hypothetical protein
MNMDMYMYVNINMGISIDKIKIYLQLAERATTRPSYQEKSKDSVYDIIVRSPVTTDENKNEIKQKILEMLSFSQTLFKINNNNNINICTKNCRFDVDNKSSCIHTHILFIENNI